MVMMVVMLLVISVARRHGKSKVRVVIKWFVKFQFENNPHAVGRRRIHEDTSERGGRGAARGRGDHIYI